MKEVDVVRARREKLGHLILLGSFALLALLLVPLHLSNPGWPDPGAARWIEAALVVAAWMGLTGWLLRRRQSALQRAPVAESLPDGETAVHVPNVVPLKTEVLVVHASQTGFAEQLARQTLQSLQVAGMASRSSAIDQLSLDELAGAGRVLFVVSTTGEGDPPDMALAFVRGAMSQPADLGNLHYGLLALGDRDYDDFCGFGRQLQHWLQASGAQPLFDAVEVDDGGAAALRHWQHHLAMVSGVNDLPDWEPPRYQRWQLVERRQLNPGSVGEPCFHLALRPRHEGAHWQAGDLVEIGPCHAADKVAAWLSALKLDGSVLVDFGKDRLPLDRLLARCRLPSADEVAGLDEAGVATRLQWLPHREYSIASLPADGTIHLLVRRMLGLGGRVGLGSGWLTEHAQPGDEIALRVRRNVNFHLPRDGRPLILIGNGTGLAALRSLLKARIAAGHRRNWLLFGERHRAHDFHYREEIERWIADGQIERADFAWSRDQAERIHVQQRLREAATELLGWVEAGAAIYVCGSLDGLAPGVDAVLRDVLGSARLEQLRMQGRYRRDVY